jgi:hypothetical protein
VLVRETHALPWRYGGVPGTLGSGLLVFSDWLRLPFGLLTSLCGNRQHNLCVASSSWHARDERALDQSLILIVWGVAVVHPVDNILRPYRSARGSCLLMCFAVIGGLKLSVPQTFIGPLILA